MIDIALPLLMLGGLIAYVALVYRAVRRLTAQSIPSGLDRKVLLYVIAFGGSIAVTALAVAVEDVISERAIITFAVLAFAGLLSSFFAILMAD